MAQWLPIYDSDPATVKSELATFFEVFPDGTVWSNFTQKEGGYDLVLIGGAASTIHVDAIQQRLDRPDYSKVLASISEVGLHSAVEVLATYADRASDLKPYFAGAAVNDDMNLGLQYLAGLGLNSMTFQKVLGEVVSYRRFPDDLFLAPPAGSTRCEHCSKPGINCRRGERPHNPPVHATRLGRIAVLRDQCKEHSNAESIEIDLLNISPSGTWNLLLWPDSWRLWHTPAIKPQEEFMNINLTLCKARSTC